jgi:hypothetical protein
VPPVSRQLEQEPAGGLVAHLADSGRQLQEKRFKEPLVPAGEPLANLGGAQARATRETSNASAMRVHVGVLDAVMLVSRAALLAGG